MSEPFLPEPSVWSEEALRLKAALYFERAFEHDPDDALFRFWCHLGLELLARACVARVSPALLAVPSGNDASIHYGLGLTPTADPLEIPSAPMHYVLRQCEHFVVGFDKAHRATCDEAVRARNAELHSGTPAFEQASSGWLGRFFKTCEVLLAHLEIPLADFLPEGEADLVNGLVEEDAKQVQGSVRKAIAEAQQRAAKLVGDARAKREQQADAQVRPRTELLSPFSRVAAADPVLRPVECPACATKIALRGRLLTVRPVRLRSDGSLTVTRIYVPTSLSCPVCELELTSRAALAIAGFSEPTLRAEEIDPVEALDIDLSEYQDDFMRRLEDEYDPYQDE